MDVINYLVCHGLREITLPVYDDFEDYQLHIIYCNFITDLVKGEKDFNRVSVILHVDRG